jgi:hypothetical protein
MSDIEAHNDQIDIYYKGLCVVHANYEGLKHDTSGDSDDIISVIDDDIGADSKRITTEFINHTDDISVHSVIDTKKKSQEKNKKYEKKNVHAFKKNLSNFVHDFSNFFPEKIRTLTGSGYIRNINGVQYVVTCNHIIVKYATYKGYSFNSEKKTVEFDMIVHKRLPEIDLVIMRITSQFEEFLPELDECNAVSPIYNSTRHNRILTCKLVQNVLEDNEEIYTSSEQKIEHNNANIINITHVLINNDLSIKFEKLKSELIQHLPIIDVPIFEIDIIKNFFEKNRIDIKKDLAIVNDRRTIISKSIASIFSGTSGSIIRSDNTNVGLVCMYVDAESGMSLKTIPLVIVDALVKNIVTNAISDLKSIQIDTCPCDIKYMNKRYYGHYVTNNSSSYTNGKKMFSFREGDILLEVDKKSFNQDKMLWSELLGVFVPLNTYTFIKSNTMPVIQIDSHDDDMHSSIISFKIAKKYMNTTKLRSCNLTSSSYNDMYKIRIKNSPILVWKNHVFLELSEELISFYKRIGMNITVFDAILNINKYVFEHRDKIVILLNYKKTIKNKLNLENYTSLPVRGLNGHYFYVVSFVGQKKILCIDDLNKVLKSDFVQKQNQGTLKLLNDQGGTKLLKIQK